MVPFELFESEYRIISIVGMAKNAGKTVTLNHMIDAITHRQKRVGLTSIGRDGERQDIVTKTEKPLIYVTKGAIIATAEILFNLSEAKMSILEVTDFQTAMGRVIIGEALSDGYVQLGGPSTNSEIRLVCEKMRGYGADYVLVDGALDRTSSASPAITDACVLSTGAVLSKDMNKAVDQTVHQVSLFSLIPHDDPQVRDLWRQAQDHKKPILVDDEGNVTILSALNTSIGAGRIIAESIDTHTRTLIIPGALVTQTVKDVIQSVSDFKHITWVVGDATKIFIARKDWLYFMRIGVQIKVHHAINVIALTVNPYAPAGYYYDSERFCEALREKIENIPIIDVMSI